MFWFTRTKKQKQGKPSCAKGQEGIALNKYVKHVTLKACAVLIALRPKVV